VKKRYNAFGKTRKTKDKKTIMDPDKFDSIVDDLEDEKDVTEEIMDSTSKSKDSEFWSNWNKTRDAQEKAKQKREEDDDD